MPTEGEAMKAEGQAKDPPAPSKEDAVPCLENMASVVWEQSLSFLPPAGIASASYRISKTFRAGEDRSVSTEKAAELALESMMQRAHMALGISVEGSIKISRFPEEKFLRTYKLASVMLRAGTETRDELFGGAGPMPSDEDIEFLTRKVDEAQSAVEAITARVSNPTEAEVGIHNSVQLDRMVEEAANASEELRQAEDVADKARLALEAAAKARNGADSFDDADSFDLNFHVIALMWLLYGRPALLPLSERQMTIAGAMAKAMTVFCLTPDPSDMKKAGFKGESGKSKMSKIKLDKYCRPRLLQIADHFRQADLMVEAMMFSNLLLYNRPMELTHIKQAEYWVGSTVVLTDLKKLEMNGKVGVVEKEFDPATGRVGVEIDDDVTGERRMVSIKTDNLSPEKDDSEEDSDFAIDVKIFQGQVICSMMRLQTNFNPPSLPVVINVLMKIEPKLREEVVATADSEEIAGEGSDDPEASDFDRPLFESNRHRLFQAETSLASLLIRAAKYIGLGMVPPTFGDFVSSEVWGEVEEQLAEVQHEELEARFKKVVACRLFLNEAKDVLSSCANKTMGPLLSDRAIIHQKELVDAGLHVCSGILSGWLKYPLLSASDVGIQEHLRNINEKFSIAMSILRTQFERMLREISEHCGGMLTVDRIMSSEMPSTYFQNLHYFSRTIGEVYGLAEAMVPEGFGDPGEDDDHEKFICFALLVAIRFFGRGHRMTGSVGFLYDHFMPTGPGWRMETTADFEKSVDEWLKTFPFCYLGTSRERPNMYRR